jgi:DNA-binding CsgD family transcriptional regulator
MPSTLPDLAHLTHVYTKVGLTSRVQLAQEAARHT